MQLVDDSYDDQVDLHVRDVPTCCIPSPIPIMVEHEQYSPNEESSPSKTRLSGGQLWKFLIEILCDGDYNPSCIIWEDLDSGIFRFISGERVANLWAKKNNRQSMKYDFMARAIRHYYKKEVILPVKVKQKRMVFRFGRKAVGWKNMVAMLSTLS